MSENPQNSDSVGGRGDDVYLTPVQRNKIVGMMLNPLNRWPTTPEIKAKALEATVASIESGDPRAMNAAVANLLKMEGQNQTDELKALDKQVPDANALAQLPLADAIAHPHYLEYLEATHMAADRHASPVGNVGEPGQVEAGKAPAPPEQGTD